MTDAETIADLTCKIEKMARLKEAVKELDRLDRVKSQRHFTGLQRSKRQPRSKVISLARELVKHG